MRLVGVLCGALVGSVVLLATPAQATTAPVAYSSVAVPAPGSYQTDPAGIGVIGDSLTYAAGLGEQGLTQHLAAGGWQDIRVDGMVGRPIAKDYSGKPGAVSVVRTWRTLGFDPRVYVIALGSNNIGATVTSVNQSIAALLAEIGPGHTVYWVNASFADPADPRVVAFDANLATVPGIVYLDWQTWIHSRVTTTVLWNPLDVNGIHMTLAGYDYRWRFIVLRVARSLASS
jgi:hypothetical protein